MHSSYSNNIKLIDVPVELKSVLPFHDLYFRKQKEQEEEEKERKKEEKIRKREQKLREKEERKNLKKVRRQQEEEQKKLQMKIAMEERRLLLAQRNLESLRLVAELLARAKVLNTCTNKTVYVMVCYNNIHQPQLLSNQKDLKVYLVSFFTCGF